MSSKLVPSQINPVFSCSIASDAIKHENTGLICDGNNLDDIYSSINSMLENKKYLEYGKNAQNYVTKFYWPNIIEKFKKILN